ncbi:MAG: hypothetical protein GKR94_33945 [Gammaproteobacteria bacterium]|nr:hypothetical protein [Gammaproteobacteria bacterium]
MQLGEGTVAMAVEALRDMAQADAPQASFLASTTLPFADQQNAGIVLCHLGRVPAGVAKACGISAGVLSAACWPTSAIAVSPIPC